MHPLEMALQHRLQSLTCLDRQQPEEPSIIIAYSGGLDSTVLLHAAWRLNQQQLIPAIEAVHINHGLQSMADSWQQHCQKKCGHYRISLRTKQLNLAKQGKLSEVEARDARYQFFKQVVKEKQVILFAHHLNDHVETLLFRLFRGTGLHGMRGIPSSRALGSGQILRPLLHFSRQQLLAYAQQHQLEWIDDPSNQSNQYHRNFIRNQLLPLIQTKWPSVLQLIQQFSKITTDQVEILDHVAANDLENIQRGNVQPNFIQSNGTLSKGTQPISIKKLAALSLARQKNLIHFWLRKESGFPPTRQIIEELVKQLDLAPASLDQATLNKKKIKLKTAHGWLRSFDKKLYFFNKEQPNAIVDNVLWFDVKQKIQLANGVTLVCQTVNDCCVKEITKNLIIRQPKANEQVTIRPRVGAETAHPAYRQHSAKLKKIYQELKIPIWQRQWLPIIYYGEQLAAVPEVLVDRSVLAETSGLIFKIENW